MGRRHAGQRQQTERRQRLDFPRATGHRRKRQPELQQFRIDEERSNAFTAWKRMGSPQEPTAEQYAALEQAGKLAADPPQMLNVRDGKAALSIRLPRQAVTLLEFTW